MGADCCTLGGEDLRPRLKVYISNAQQLPMLDNKKEIEAYVQLRFGPLKGNRNDQTYSTNTVKTSDRDCKWDETIYIPVAAVRSRYSLEVSVWDQDSIDANDLCGTVMIHHAGYKKDDAKYWLPNKANDEQEYNLKLTSKDGSYAGEISLTCMFIAAKNSNMDEPVRDQSL